MENAVRHWPSRVGISSFGRGGIPTHPHFPPARRRPRNWDEGLKTKLRGKDVDLKSYGKVSEVGACMEMSEGKKFVEKRAVQRPGGWGCVGGGVGGGGQTQMSIQMKLNGSFSKTDLRGRYCTDASEPTALPLSYR